MPERDYPELITGDWRDTDKVLCHYYANNIAYRIVIVRGTIEGEMATYYQVQKQRKLGGEWKLSEVLEHSEERIWNTGNTG